MIGKDVSPSRNCSIAEVGCVKNPIESCNGDMPLKVGRSRANEAESILVRDLNELSLRERERVFEEVHGVAAGIDESPSLVELRLSQLEDEILKVRKRQAYDRALFLAPGVVKDPDFRLMFLRADLFDPRKTSQ